LALQRSTSGENSAIVWFMLLALCSFASAQELAPAPEPETTAASGQPAQPVSIGEIPERVQQSAAIVREASRHAAPIGSIVEIERTFPEFAAGVRILLRKSRTLFDLDKSAGVALAQNLQGTWRTAHRRLDAWQSTLKGRSGDLHKDLAALQRESGTWKATKEGADRQELPKDVIEEIGRNLNLIEKTRQAVLSRRNDILKLQGAISALGIELDELDEDLQNNAEAARGRLLQLNAPPLWRADATASKPEPLPQAEPETAPQTIEIVKIYLVGVLAVIASQAVAFAVLLALLLALRRRVSSCANSEGRETRRLSFILGRPLSAALLLSVFGGLMLDARVRELLLNFGWYVLLIPMVRIVAGIVSPGMKRAIWLLAALYAVYGLSTWLPAGTIWPRLFALLLAFAGTSGLLWLDKGLRKTLWSGGWLYAAIVCIRVAALLLCIAFAAEIAGATTLSRYLLNGVVRTVYGAVVVYGLLLVLHSVLDAVLQAKSEISAPLTHSMPGLQERLSSGLNWLGLIPFFTVVLRAFHLSQPLTEFARAASRQSISLGAIEFTLGSAVTFAAIVLAASILSQVLRFFLSAGLYGRMALQRGTGAAISKLLHYAVLTGGFLLALGAAGIDLNRFTVLAGAFGVGAGLGFQNVVSNFVSGLILLFERPLHVGDKVTVGDTSGEVKDIGIRASRILTWDGADVIIPNASLISGNFTNWTLSNDLRRGELKVGVAYGTHPGRVLRILREVASDHPLILQEREPVALFTGFGESSLDFSIRYWTLLDNYVAVGSQLHEAVCERLARESIEIPFPQRDLNLRNVEPEVLSPPPEPRAVASASPDS
jgi:potassium-dependent mechanosensitive channel